MEALRRENIGTSVHYLPVHLQPYYRERFGFRRGDFPVAEAEYRKMITLPLFSKMTDDDQADVIRAVTRLVDYYRK
jgi:dTDP-4-amino-4,6-dideoxygalactose transaminase